MSNFISNPFIYGSPVESSSFFNRKRELRTLIQRTITGQSSAVVGEPHIGKTSLLFALSAYINSEKLNASQRLHICNYIDSQAIPSGFTQSEFWELALDPFINNSNQVSKNIQECLRLTQANRYGTYTLEKFFNQLKMEKINFSLLIDEFDVLLYHKALNSAEFFGGMRSLASRSRSLSVITSSRQSLSQLNAATQQINPTGSPYFNIFSEIVLGSFSTSDVDELISQGNEKFDRFDRDFIRFLSGGHPYILQTLSSTLWEIIDSDEYNNRSLAYNEACNRVKLSIRQHFDDCWRYWTSPQRQAFTVIGLSQISDLISKRAFNVGELIEDLRDLQPEIDDFTRVGLLKKDNQAASGWYIIQPILLWWLEDELTRVIRTDENFQNWLRAQELDGLLTRQQRDKLSTAIFKLRDMLGSGAKTFFETAVESFAEGFANGLIS